MFYVFKTSLVGWKNSLLQATPNGPLSDYEPWWGQAEPFNSPPKLPLFSISSKAPKLDVYFTGLQVVDLFSIRLVNILREADAKFESFPATVLDRKTKEIVPLSYEAPHLFEILPVLDENLTIVKHKIEKLVLNEEVNSVQTPMFRVKKRESVIIINESLKSILEANSITGYTCCPVNEYPPKL